MPIQNAKSCIQYPDIGNIAQKTGDIFGNKANNL